METQRTCSKCGQEKPIRDFVKQKVCPSGYGRECLACKRVRSRIYTREYRKLYPAKVAAQLKTYRARNRVYQHDLYQQLKEEVLAAYGGACLCCGEDRTVFLTIDHVNNDGYLYRRKGQKHSGTNIYRFLKKQGFPKDDYQVLCANCNFAKQHNPEGHRAAHPNAEKIEGNGPKSLCK